MTWHSDFIKQCLSSSQPINDATAYGVEIVPAVVPAGQAYYKIIGVHHLTGAENAGNHHLFADALDSDGFRINGAHLIVENANGQQSTLVVDKPNNEPGTNAPMYWPDTLAIWASGLLSDKATGIHTRHPDEGPGNTLGHHSFYVVFQVAQAGDTGPEPPPPPPPTDPPRALKRFTVWRYFTNEGWAPVHTGDSLTLAIDAYWHNYDEAGTGGHVYLMDVLE